MSSIEAEEQRFRQDIKELEQWWQDSRWKFTRRPYTAEQIANKRGNIKIEYPSNAMSKKLWDMVEKRFAVSSIPMFKPHPPPPLLAIPLELFRLMLMSSNQ